MRLCACVENQFCDLANPEIISQFLQNFIWCHPRGLLRFSTLVLLVCIVIYPGSYYRVQVELFTDDACDLRDCIVQPRMSEAREADVAILDTIESDLARAAKKRKIAGKRSAKGRSEKECGSGTVVDPTGVPPETDSSTGGPSTPTAGASTAATSASTVDLLQLQSTVSVLAEQMAWFVDRLQEPEEIDAIETTADLPLATGEEAQPLANLPSDTGTNPSVEPTADPLSALEKFYGVADTTGPDIDPQLARIVESFIIVRLTDEKLKEKLTAGLVPKNCECLKATRVNPEIWDKLSTTSKSRDIKAQRIENAIVQAMLAITSAADTLVRKSRSGEELGQPKMATTVTSLVDALALLATANQDVNQRRRDDHRADLNQAYKGLCKGDQEASALLYGDDITTRIKDINESNRVASKLGTASKPSTPFPSRPGQRGRMSFPRAHPYAAGSSGRSSWMGRFRGGFLEPGSHHTSRGKSFPRRGHRPRSRSAAQSGRDNSA